MTIEESEYHDANKVRVVKFDDITLDLCGGTHVENSSLIENFKIISVDSKGTAIYRLRAITSNKSVNEYLDNEIIKYQKLLKSLIVKNQEFDKTYNKEFKVKKIESISDKEEMLTYYERLEEEIRNDYKTFLKEQQNQQIDLDKYQFEQNKNLKLFILFENEPSYLKKVCVQLREKYVDSLIIGLSKNKNNYFLIVASKLYDSKKIFDKLSKLLNGKGGGNNIICQGSINSSLEESELKQKIIEITNA